MIRCENTLRKLGSLSTKSRGRIRKVKSFYFPNSVDVSTANLILLIIRCCLLVCMCGSRIKSVRGRGLGEGGPDCFYHQLISQMDVWISLEKLFVLSGPIASRGVSTSIFKETYCNL